MTARTEVHFGADNALREAALDVIARGSWGRVLMLFPAQRHAMRRIERLLLDHELAGAWGEPALTLTDFARRLLRAEGIHATPLTNEERSLLIQEVIARLADRGVLDAAGASAKTAGFASHLLRVIEGLKQAAIEPALFQKVVGRRLRPHPYDEMVVQAYTAYQDTLNTGDLYDRIGVFWRASLICEKHRPRLLDSVDTLIVDGFDDFTPTEFRLLKTLRPHVSHIVFGIRFDQRPEAADLFALQKRTIGELIREFDAPAIEHAATPPTTMRGYAAAHLLWRGEPPTPSAPLVHDVEVVPCVNGNHELEVIAHNVKRLLQAGTPLEDIMIAFPDVASIAPAIHSIFGGFDIPARVNAATPLSQSAVCAFLLAFLDMLASWKREDVVDVLQSPWLSLEGESSSTIPSMTEALAAAAGILGGADEWLQGLDALAEAMDSRIIPGFNRLPGALKELDTLRARVKQLKVLSDAIPEEGEPAALADALESLMEALGVRRAITALPWLDDASREAESLAWENLPRILGLLRNWRRGQVISWNDFLSAFRRCLDTAGFQLPGFTNAVLCMDISRLRNLTCKYLFCGGLNEGSIPRRPVANAIYSEKEFTELRNLGVPLESAEIRAERELALFQGMLNTPETSLCLTWRMISSEGRQLKRSPFLEELIRLFPGERIEAPEPAPDCFIPRLDEAASLNGLRTSLAFHAKDAIHELPDIMSSVAMGKEIEDERNTWKTFGPCDGVLTAESILRRLEKRFGPTHVYSVNQIETYQDCPFQFLVLRGLGLSPIEPRTETFEALDKGLILHDALERFHRRFEGIHVSLILDAEAAMNEVLGSVIARHIRRAPERYAQLLQAEEGALRRLLRQYLFWERQAQASGNPRHFEVSFGKTGGEPGEGEMNTLDPFPLPASAGEILFSGKIDRMDERTDGLCLVDYKTGKPPGASEIKDGRAIQLPLYIMAVESHIPLERPCVEARYIQVGAAGPAKGYLAISQGDAWRKAMDATREAVVNVTEAIKRGQFPPTPLKDACPNCSVKGVCRHTASRIGYKVEAGAARA